MQTNEVKYQQVENPLATADILGITSVMVQDMSGKRYVALFPPKSILTDNDTASIITSSIWMS